jgi:hypothetical protein
MRIVLTKNGERVVNILGSEQDKIRRQKEEEIKNNVMVSLNNVSVSDAESEVILDNSYSGNRGSSVGSSRILSSINPGNISKVTVSQKKVNVPKNIMEKYNSPNDSQVILPQIPEIIMERHKKISKEIEGNFEKLKQLKDDNVKESFLQLRSIPLKYIIEDSTKKNMEDKLNYREKMKQKLFNLNEVKFRTPYSKNRKNDDFERSLNFQIQPNHINLIQYINSDRNLNDRFIGKLSKYDDAKLKKINKLCQVILHNKKEEEVFREKVKNRLQYVKSTVGKDSESVLQAASKNLLKINEITNDYYINQSLINRKERVKQIHSDIKREYWDKYKLDRFSSLARRKNFLDTNSFMPTDELRSSHGNTNEKR